MSDIIIFDVGMSDGELGEFDEFNFSFSFEDVVV